jgi:hypothetical protein
MLTLIAPVPWVAPQVERIRAVRDWSARLGVGAHITLLGGLRSAPSTPQLATLLASRPTLHARLARLELLGDAACLLPDEPGPLRELSRLLAAALGVEAPVYTPHVTVARDCEKGDLRALRRELAATLPVEGPIERVLVIERRDGEEQARQLASLPLSPELPLSQ